MSTQFAPPEEAISPEKPASGVRQVLQPDSIFARLSRAIVTSGGGFILGWSFFREVGGIIGIMLGLLIFYISERVQED